MISCNAENDGGITSLIGALKFVVGKTEKNKSPNINLVPLHNKIIKITTALRHHKLYWITIYNWCQMFESPTYLAVHTLTVFNVYIYILPLLIQRKPFKEIYN